MSETISKNILEIEDQIDSDEDDLIQTEDLDLEVELETEESEFNKQNFFKLNEELSFDESQFNPNTFVRSGLEDQHRYILEYLETGDYSCLDKAVIKFDLPMKIKIESFDEELRRNTFNILVDFQKYLNIIKNSYLNKSNDFKSIARFPLLYLSKIKKQRFKKNRGNSEIMAVIHMLVASGFLDEAIKKCLSSIQENPRNPRILNMISYLYNEVGDVENSLKFAFSSILLCKRDSIQYHYIGMLFIKNGFLTKGIEFLENSIRFIPKYIPAFWELVCQLFINEEYSRVLAVILSFLRYPINEYFDLHLKLVKSIIENFKTNLNWRRVPISLEVFLTSIAPYYDHELFISYCEMMDSKKMYKELFKGFFKIFDFPKGFLNYIIDEEIESEMTDNWRSFLNYLPHDAIIYFSISTIHSHPQSIFIKPLLNYIKSFNIESEKLIKVVDALCYNKSFEMALEIDLVNQDFLDQNDEIKMHVVVYYIEINQIMKAYDCSSSLNFSTAPCYFQLLSGIFSIINQFKDQVISYFILFYNQFIEGGIIRTEMNHVLVELSKKYPYLIDKNSDDFSISLTIISYFIILSPEDMESLKITPEDIKIHLIKVLEVFTDMGISFAKSILAAFEIATKVFQKGISSYHQQVNFEVKFLTISTMIKFEEYYEAYSAICDILTNHDKKLILDNSAFFNLFAYVAVKTDSGTDKRRLVRIIDDLNENSRLEFCLLSNFINRRGVNVDPMIKFKYSFKACQLSGMCTLPFLIHASNIFKYSFMKSINRPHIYIIQSFIFIMIYFKKAGGFQSIEACYNIGRYFHGLGYLSYAENFYRISLSLQASDNSYIRRVSAYNLALIYENSNNRCLSNIILRQYLTF